MIDGVAAARQWACQQQLVRFFDLLDAKCYDEIPGLFEERGAWVRPDTTLHGRDAILASLMQRPAHRRTRHMVTNFLVDADRGEEVDARCSLVTFAIEETDEGAPPKRVDALAGLYVAKATLRCVAGAASIARLELAPEMTFDRGA